LELKQLEQKIELDRENFRLYLAKLEQARISDAMDSEKIASVSLMGPARPPRKPVSPKLKLNILIGIFLGIFGSLSLALFREYLDDRIEKIEDVEGELRLPVLASIPVFEKKTAGA
jgi:capsular polysaccharide biosynthesis protein